MESFRDLRADEIEIRVQSINPYDSGKTKCSMLLYKDARCDMNILDETVGPENWQRDHKEIKGVLYGGIGIWCENKKQWVWKWDAGSESFAEKEKGESSDSFKRAAVNWKPGRELYSPGAKNINVWLEANEWKNNNKGKPALGYKVKFSVGEIVTIDGKIEKLVIVDQNGKQRYKYDSKKPKAKPKTTTPPQPKEELSQPEKEPLEPLKVTTLENTMKEARVNIEQILARYKVTALKELSLEDFKNAMDSLGIMIEKAKAKKNAK